VGPQKKKKKKKILSIEKIFLQNTKTKKCKKIITTGQQIELATTAQPPSSSDSTCNTLS
jgi:hypothetical protein